MIHKQNESARQLGWTNEVAEDTELYNHTVSQVDNRIQSLATQQRIKSAINISLFLSSKNENVDDSDDDIVDTIAEVYGDDERAYETGEEGCSQASYQDK